MPQGGTGSQPQGSDPSCFALKLLVQEPNEIDDKAEEEKSQPDRKPEQGGIAAAVESDLLAGEMTGCCGSLPTEDGKRPRGGLQPRGRTRTGRRWRDTQSTEPMANPQDAG